MKYALIGLALSALTNSAFSFFLNADIYQGENVVLDYAKPNGALNADHLKIKNPEMSFEGSDINATIEAQANKLVLKMDNFEFELTGGMFDAIKDYSSARVSLEKVDSNPKSSELSASEIDLRNGDRTLIRTVDIECASTTSKEIIDQCIESGVLTVDYVLAGGSTLWKKVLDLQVSEETEIKNIFLSIEDGNYQLNLKVSGVKIKVLGTISHNGEVIDVWIKSAKAGLFGVKDRLLNELKKLEGDMLKVEGDHLLITL